MAGDQRKKASLIRQFAAASSACLMSLCGGMFIGWTSPTLPILQAGEEEPYLTLEEGTWVGSLLPVGAFIGCLPAGMLSDMLGRKRILLILLIPLSMSWCLLLFAPEVWCYFLARLAGGFTIGVMSVAIPAYINEVATSDVRGALGALFQFQLVGGILIMYVVGLLSTVFSMTLVCSLVPIVFFLCFVWMPESPSFLMSKGRTREATEALQWLRGPEYNIESEFLTMQESLSENGEAQKSLVDVFKTPVSRKTIMIAMALMFYQQGSGINAVVFYAHDILEQSGSTIPPQLASIAITFVTVLATGCSSLLIDKAGRRALLIFSDFVMLLCLVVLGAYVKWSEAMSGMGWIPLVSLALYSIAFSVGFGPIPWIMMTELFTADLRASASSITAAYSWGLAFLVTKFFQNLVTLIGVHGTFWLFAAFCATGTIIVWFWIPETKGKTTEEILISLGGKKNVVEPSKRLEAAL